jgi:hypothetical protein
LKAQDLFFVVLQSMRELTQEVGGISQWIGAWRFGRRTSEVFNTKSALRQKINAQYVNQL